MVGKKGQKSPGNPNIKKYGFGSRPKEVDDEYRKRARGVPKWTKEKCIKRINDILDRLDIILLETKKVENEPNKLKLEHIRDLKIMMNSLLDFLKYMYPPVQQNVNVNVDLTADNVIERLKKLKKEEVYVIKENKKKEKNDK